MYQELSLIHISLKSAEERFSGLFGVGLPCARGPFRGKITGQALFAGQSPAWGTRAERSAAAYGRSPGCRFGGRDRRRDNSVSYTHLPRGQTVFISHGDCPEDAGRVAEMVKKRFGCKTVMLNYVGPVIGAHSGPGTVALFFLGRER